MYNDFAASVVSKFLKGTTETVEEEGNNYWLWLHQNTHFILLH